MDRILCIPQSHTVAETSAITWKRNLRKAPIPKLPVLFWSNGDTWSEANLWVYDRVLSGEIKVSSADSDIKGILKYANWLEDNDMPWDEFTARFSESPLSCYRGYLIKERDKGSIAPSTTSARMSVAIKFYRWIYYVGLISPTWPMWEERTIGIKKTDTFGFEFMLKVASTKLAIPIGKRSGDHSLEDGVLPISLTQASEIINFANTYATEELSLMLRLGFQTGMRIGSICDLKEETILSCLKSYDNAKFLHIGPGARPPVATKFSVTGRVLIPNQLLLDLGTYITKPRRLLRKAKARSLGQDHTLVFLTPDGNAYGSIDKSPGAIHTALSRLRSQAIKQGNRSLIDFYFHRSRATFASTLMRSALEHFNTVDEAITFVRDACLHKDSQVTLAYIKFIENSAAREKAANDFSKWFMGRSIAQ